MEYNNWNLEPLDASKRSPFNVALDLFEAVLEADKIRRAKEAEDTWRAASLAKACNIEATIFTVHWDSRGGQVEGSFIKYFNTLNWSSFVALFRLMSCLIASVGGLLGS
jgi:hypothetical protein